MNGARYLIDVLTPRALRTDGGYLNFGIWDMERCVHYGYRQYACTLDYRLSVYPVEPIVAKSQQKSNKETKKPKKDTSVPKPLAGGDSSRPMAGTTVYTKIKAKDK